jgi:hypothetical protein
MQSFSAFLVLHRMMRKSHGHDKRLSPQGSLQGRHER